MPHRSGSVIEQDYIILMQIRLQQHVVNRLAVHATPGTLRLIMPLFISLSVTAAQADPLSLADGHAFEPSQFNELTLDAGGRLHSDAQRGGVKITLPERLGGVAFFLEGWGSQGQLDDVSVSSDVEFSGQGEGVGFYLTGLPDWNRTTTTLRVAYHREEHDVDSVLAVAGRQATIESQLRNLSARLLFSPREPIHASGLTGYLAVGIANHRERRRLSVDQQLEPRLSRTRSDIQGYLAAGVVYPANSFRFYTVAEYQDSLSINAGMRWLISRTAGQ